MKILSEYVEICKSIESLEQKRGLSRVKSKPRLIKAHHNKEELEQKLVSHIKNYLIPLETVKKRLQEYEVESFLESNDELKSFLLKEEIAKEVGFDSSEYEGRIKKYKDLCTKAWDDYIITTKERKHLDDFCKKNKIDSLKQEEIEKQVFKEIYSENIDLTLVVKHYYLGENLDVEEIKDILSDEYKCDIPLKKLESLVNELENELVDNDVERVGKTKLIHTIHFSHISVYVVCVNGELNSDKDFEIGFVTDEPNSFRILIGKAQCQEMSDDRMIEIITDGICYYLTKDGDLDNFLVLKPSIRASVMSNIIS